MDDFNTVSDVQEEVVASPTEQQNDTSEVEVTEAENANVTEEEVAAPRQDAEMNAAFAAMRRAKEEAERQLQTAKERFTRLGYTADELGTIAEQIEAERQGIDVIQLRAQQAAAEEAAKNSPAYKQLEGEVAALRARQQAEQFNKDLSEIKKLYPSEKAKDISELGQEYANLRANGISNLVAYKAVVESRTTKTPPTVGKVNATGVSEAEYFSSEELDNLTAEQLGDDKIRAKAIRSMAKLK